MYAIKKQAKKEDTFVKAMKSVLDGNFIGTLSDDILNILLKVLEEIYDDTISYFLYELDFGKKDHNSMMVNNKVVPLSNVEDLWNYCNGLKK